MFEDYKNKLINYLMIAVMIVVGIGGITFAYPAYQRERSLRRESEELKQEIERLKRERAMLMENQQRFKTDSDFVEMIARQNRRVFPGELVFLFSE